MREKFVWVFGTVLVLVSVLVQMSVAAADEPEVKGPLDESVSVSMDLAPRLGSFYRGGAVPAKLSISVATTSPPSQLVITPSIRGMVKLPPDLTFNPKRSMPVCPDSKLGPKTPKSIISQAPAKVIALCPKSVIGNGNSLLHLARTKASRLEGQLIIFHAGWNAAGQPKIKLWGYSKGVTAGALMTGFLREDNTVAIDVPVLPFNSSIGSYDLNVPGDGPVTYDGKPVKGSRGLDPSYAMAKCSRGSWPVSGVATLGERDDAGTNTGPIYQVPTPKVTVPCEGRPGKPQLGKLKLKGPSRAAKGKPVTFKVSVRDRLGADANSTRIKATGNGVSGSAKIGTVPAGKSKQGKVKVRLTKTGSIKVQFTVTAAGRAPIKLNKTIRVK